MSSSATNVVAFSGRATPDQYSDAVRRLQSSIDAILASQNLLASVTRAKYLALMREGFTAAEALELCK